MLLRFFFELIVLQSRLQLVNNSSKFPRGGKISNSKTNSISELSPSHKGCKQRSCSRSRCSPNIIPSPIYARSVLARGNAYLTPEFVFRAHLIPPLSTARAARGSPFVRVHAEVRSPCLCYKRSGSR